MEIRAITKAEWDKYEWIEVTRFCDAVPVFIRGSKKTEPPDDGFVYREVTKLLDSEQSWQRIYEVIR